MRIDYSKSSSDIKRESLSRFEEDRITLKKQRDTIRLLVDAARRNNCTLCNKPLKGEAFYHRTIPFVICGNCSQIQMKVIPPAGYERGFEFHVIYPKLDRKNYNDRKARIYKPKADWIINCLKELKVSSWKRKRWFEIGAGAGYFLDSLKDIGISDFGGIDQDSNLVELANSVLRHECVHRFSKNFASAVTTYRADIYCAFFVLEHVSSLHDACKALRKLRKGTIFIFSVPVFGLTTILENLFTESCARQLDGIVHQQLFTDESIDFMLQASGFKPVASWIFGQDIDDLKRFILTGIKKKCGPELLTRTADKISLLQDSLQECVDRAQFADQRHIIAIKTHD